MQKLISTYSNSAKKYFIGHNKPQVRIFGKEFRTNTRSHMPKSLKLLWTEEQQK